MYRKHDSLVPKPNHECNLCDYTFSIKEVLAMHMHKEHNGAAPVQKSCNMCLFTSHLSDVLKDHIDRKHICIKKKKHYNVISVICLPRKHHEHLKNGEEAYLMFELCDYRTSDAPYLKSQMHPLCYAYC